MKTIDLGYLFSYPVSMTYYPVTLTEFFQFSGLLFLFMFIAIALSGATSDDGGI